MDDMKNLPAAKRSMMAMTSCSLLNSSLPLWTSTRYRSIKSLILEKNGFHYNGNNDDVDYDGDGASPLSTSTRYRSNKASSPSSPSMTVIMMQAPGVRLIKILLMFSNLSFKQLAHLTKHVKPREQISRTWSGGCKTREKTSKRFTSAGSYSWRDIFRPEGTRRGQREFVWTTPPSRRWTLTLFNIIVNTEECERLRMSYISHLLQIQ